MPWTFKGKPPAGIAIPGTGNGTYSPGKKKLKIRLKNVVIKPKPKHKKGRHAR